ncbi:MAG: amidohydrolase, partial [Ruminococcaceae bacterium]|nr:amidohydrolase [Oscillospiraceae bacterium]
MLKKEALSVIDEKQQIFTDVSDKIWEYAELSLLEYQSMELYCKVLAENGFQVEKNLCGVPTAFSGSFGSGRPVIGILGEFDALSGLSQKCGVAQRDELVAGGNGHGCGHNMLGAGSLAAAFAVKAYLEKSGKSGTVIFFGCPGEEGGAGKAFMARDRSWEKLDAALSWHPEDHNKVTTGSCISCIQVEYKFTGIAAHAAGNPEAGRSALDAVELMNIGVQFLREHMADSARIHYAITDAGGNSPNVVQPTAQVLYMVRDHKVREAMRLQERVDKIAEAAAMMTETKLTRRFIDGTANTVSNARLEKLL